MSSLRAAIHEAGVAPADREEIATLRRLHRSVAERVRQADQSRDRAAIELHGQRLAAIRRVLVTYGERN